MIRLIKAFSTAATCYVKEIAKVFSKFRDPQMVNNNVDKWIAKMKEFDNVDWWHRPWFFGMGRIGGQQALIFQMETTW